LHVANILEGTVHKEGDRVRISVELTKASDGFQLWSKSYDRQIGDIFAVQDEIANSVVNELQLKLAGTGRAPLPRNAATTSEAYQAYLLGKYFLRRHEASDWKKALSYAEETINLDPKYAPGWALQAAALSYLAESGVVDYEAGHNNARESARKAISLDPTLADGYLALARVQVYHDFDLPAAAASLAKASEFAPEDGEVDMARANVAKFEGHFDEAIALDKKALSLDPLSGWGGWEIMGWCLFNQGRYQEALAVLDRALEVEPQAPTIHFKKGLIFLAQNHAEPALAEMRREIWEDHRLLGASLVYYATGRRQESDSALSELIAKHSKDSAYQIAEAYAYCNNADKAFEWLNRGYQQRDAGLLSLQSDPMLKNLHQDPRYTDLLRKMNL